MMSCRTQGSLRANAALIGLLIHISLGASSIVLCQDLGIKDARVAGLHVNHAQGESEKAHADGRSKLLTEQLLGCDGSTKMQLQIYASHPWRPPFGLDRVGGPMEIHVELAAINALRGNYYIVTYEDDRETERHRLSLARQGSSYFGAANLKRAPAKLALQVQCMRDGPVQLLATHNVRGSEIEADIEVTPLLRINPVDLGTVLVPDDWILLGPGQTAVVVIAAMARRRSISDARVVAWFDGERPVQGTLPLEINKRAVTELSVPLTGDGHRSVLHVGLYDGNRQLWKKEMRTMIASPQDLPRFGAVLTKLRYEEPIPIHDTKTGTSSSMDYDRAWDPKLNDIVVSLPNGSRFVFWRGSSYAPFWAGLYNTGFSYEWAETMPPPSSGIKTSIEPIHDKELRYSRVKIMESTSSRIHVRWEYQPTDLDYTVFGDYAIEDFFFYPDGFGTRVVTLVSAPAADYELTDFIIITPKRAYPFKVLPSDMVDVLYLDGEKHTLQFPYRPPSDESAAAFQIPIPARRNEPALYRVHMERRDPSTPIYFSPMDIPQNLFAFSAIHDHGEIVSPVYWGSHWPLSRGNPGSVTIDDGIHLGPAHVVPMGWGLMSRGNRPLPLASQRSQRPDALGRSRDMIVRRWAWLIANTAAADAQLVKWAQSYSAPPSLLRLRGARNAAPAYAAERRAMRLIAESSMIEITLAPEDFCMNPVFELEGAPENLLHATIDGTPLSSDMYAWDGKTLWLDAAVPAQGASIRLQFQPEAAPSRVRSFDPTATQANPAPHPAR